MKKVVTAKTHNKRRIWLWIGLGLIVALIIFRLFLPTIVLNYVNNTLQEIEGYTGHVNDIDISIYRGAYQIQGVELKKLNGKVPVPFFAAHNIDISIQWKELFKGELVGEIIVFKPQINFVKGPTPEQTQSGVDSSWVDVVDKWIPVRLNQLLIQQGEIHYRDFSTKPNVDVYLKEVEARAINLSNTNKSNQLLPSTVTATANAYGNGTLKLNMKLNALAKDPTFDLNSELEGVDLFKLNDFLKAYAKIDVRKGTFGLYTEIAAKNGKYKGYVKPTIENLDILQLEKSEGNILQIAWEAVVAGAGKLLENKASDRVASKVPIEGTFEKTNVDIMSTVASLLRNAFIQALFPSIDQSINISKVDGKAVIIEKDGKSKKK